VTPPRYDPPRRVTPEEFAFYKMKAQRLRFAARRRALRQLCAWVVRLLRRGRQHISG
jgi:hypothetical protein